MELISCHATVIGNQLKIVVSANIKRQQDSTQIRHINVVSLLLIILDGNIYELIMWKTDKSNNCYISAVHLCVLVFPGCLFQYTIGTIKPPLAINLTPSFLVDVTVCTFLGYVYFSLDISSYEGKRVASVSEVFRRKRDICTSCKSTPRCIIINAVRLIVEIVVRAFCIIMHICQRFDMQSTVAHEQGCIMFNMKRNKARGGRKSIIIFESFASFVLQHFVEINVSKNTSTSTTTVQLRRIYSCKKHQKEILLITLTLTCM